MPKAISATYKVSCLTGHHCVRGKISEEIVDQSQTDRILNTAAAVASVDDSRADKTVALVPIERATSSTTEPCASLSLSPTVRVPPPLMPSYATPRVCFPSSGYPLARVGVIMLIGHKRIALSVHQAIRSANDPRIHLRIWFTGHQPATSNQGSMCVSMKHLEEFDSIQHK